MPRSGTTWIGKIFDSHLRTLYRHEPDTWDKITAIPLLADASEYARHCEFLENYVQSFVSTNRVEVSGKLPFFKKSYASALRQNLFEGSVLLSGAVSRVFKQVRLPVVTPCSAQKSSETIVVWKSIQLLGRMGVITNCLANAKGIQILRHPCGYIASVLRGESQKKFTSGTPASEDYSLYEKLLNTKLAQDYGLTIASFKTLAAEERLAWRWVLFNEKAMQDTRDNLNVRVLRYEDMCVNPIEVSKDCFQFCGLDWCEQTAAFLGQSTHKNSDAYYSVYKNPEKAANKWRTAMHHEVIQRIEKIVLQSDIGKYYAKDF